MTNTPGKVNEGFSEGPAAQQEQEDDSPVNDEVVREYDDDARKDLKETADTKDIGWRDSTTDAATKSTRKYENAKPDAPLRNSPGLSSKYVQAPQQPLVTPKDSNRPFPQPYHDVAAIADPIPDSRRNRGGVSETFPQKLHTMLDTVEREGLTDIVGFFSHGRAFAIHRPKRFVEMILPRFFKQTRYTSFQRQLNLYGFKRITRGSDSGGYYHELFLRGRPGLVVNMKRTKVKGTKKRRRDPETEPNFYSYPPVISNQVPASQAGATTTPSHYLSTSSKLGLASYWPSDLASSEVPGPAMLQTMSCTPYPLCARNPYYSYLMAPPMTTPVTFSPLTAAQMMAEPTTSFLAQYPGLPPTDEKMTRQNYTLD